MVSRKNTYTIDQSIITDDVYYGVPINNIIFYLMTSFALMNSALGFVDCSFALYLEINHVCWKYLIHLRPHLSYARFEVRPFICFIFY